MESREAAGAADPARFDAAAPVVEVAVEEDADEVDLPATEGATSA